MAQVRTQLPQGRYGRSADERADHRLKIIGAVLGVAAIVGLAWYGYSSVADQSVSGQIITYQRVSDSEVRIHLEVNKGKDRTGSCTVRALDTDHDEVGRKTVRYAQHATQVDQVITLRTTARATASELVGCSDS